MLWHVAIGAAMRVGLPAAGEERWGCIIGVHHAGITGKVIPAHHSQLAGYDIVTIVSGGALHQNCHLVLCRSSRDLVIIDPGMNVPAILDAIRELDGRPKYLLITHGHPDHIAGASDLTNEFDLDCLIDRRDQRTLLHAPGYAAAFGMTKIRVPERVRFLDGSQEFRLGEDTIRITAVPGHTTGSVAISIGDAVFTGDTLFRENVGRTDLPEGDPGALIESIDGLLAATPADATLLPGHGRPWTNAEASHWWADRGRSVAALQASRGRKAARMPS